MNDATKWENSYHIFPATPEQREHLLPDGTKEMITLYRIHEGTPAERLLSDASYQVCIGRIKHAIETAAKSVYTELPCFKCGKGLGFFPSATKITCPACGSVMDPRGYEYDDDDETEIWRLEK